MEFIIKVVIKYVLNYLLQSYQKASVVKMSNKMITITKDINNKCPILEQLKFKYLFLSTSYNSG
jgi:hypothetical protein